MKDKSCSCLRDMRCLETEGIKGVVFGSMRYSKIDSEGANKLIELVVLIFHCWRAFRIITCFVDVLKRSHYSRGDTFTDVRFVHNQVNK
jgi:copper homeostasis protein CutC